MLEQSLLFFDIPRLSQMRGYNLYDPSKLGTCSQQVVTHDGTKSAEDCRVLMMVPIIVGCKLQLHSELSFSRPQ